MTPRLSGHFSMLSLVFFVLKSFLGIARQWSCEKFAIFSHKLRSHVRISIYRIERGLLVSSANWISPCDESIKKVIFRIKPVYMYSYSEIALIHDTRHVRTRFRVDGIKASHLPIGLIAVEFVYTVKRVRRFYYCKMSSSSCDKLLRHF